MKKAERPDERGVVMILGGDTYLGEEAVEQTLRPLIGSDRTDALQVFYGDETTWARVLDAARSPSLFVPEQVVLVRGADGLKGSDEEVGRFLADVPDGVTLVLVAAKVDRRKSVWKQLLERAHLMLADPLKPRELRRYVAEKVRVRKLPLDEEGVEELVEHVGQDLRRLMGELDKIEAFARGRATVTAEEVASLVGKGLVRPAYRLSDAVVGRDLPVTLQLIDELLEEGEAAQYVLGVLYRAVRQVRGASALRADHASREEMAARLRVPPFKVPDLLAAAARWSAADLRRAQEALGLADRRVKSGGQPGVALSAAAIAMCGRKAAHDPRGSR